MRRALGALAVLVLLAACTREARPPDTSTTTTVAASTRPVRVGVWMAPDPAAGNYGGAAVRSLVHPQLFRAAPAGRWEPSLVQPGTDRTSKDATSARFRLRRGVRWSDGEPITVHDLRRTLDSRFVTAVDDPTARGTIVVHFTQALPGWRRLWSGLDAIRPPRDGVFGGPYRVEKVTPNFETVLVANDQYWGDAPRIREVRFMLVPVGEIQIRLMEKGELDVIAPLAFPDRRERLDRIDDAHVVAGERGGWTASFVANPSRLDLTQRAALLDLAGSRARRFVDVVLHDEAKPTANEFRPRAPAPKTSARPAITSPLESGPGGLLLHAMQREAHKAGRAFDLRQAEFGQVLGAYGRGEFDVLFRLEPTFLSPCWTCSYGPVDAALAKRADEGERAAVTDLRRRLTTDALVLPLWRELPVAAVRDGLEGVSVNGYHVGGPAWNLETWRWAD